MTKTALLRKCLQGMMRWQDPFERIRENDAPWLVERLRWHKLMPLAASLNDPKHPKCATLDAAFHEMQLQNLAREQHYYQQIKDVFALLDAQGIRFTPYKGPFWGSKIFPQYSWRHIGDIDLLMDVDAARAAACALRDQGYVLEVLGETAEDDFRLRGELTCHPGKDMKHRVPVQLHWELMPAPRFLKRHFIAPEDFAAGATAAEWRSIKFSLPTAEVRFLYHVLHATCQHQFNRFVLVMDMVLFLSKHPEFDWRRLFELARERACLGPLYYGLKFIKAFQELPTGADELMRLAKPNLSTRLLAGWLSPMSALHFAERRGRLRRKLFRLAMSR